MPRVRALTPLLVLPLAAVLVGAALRAAGPQVRPAYPGSAHEGPAFELRRVVDGVYHAVGTGSMAVGANATAIVGDDGVLLVDSHVSPAAAAVLLEELKAVTDRPVREVVNTHFHFDHAHGNQVYPPGVEIIGHEFTREMMASGRSMAGRSWDAFIGTLPEQIAELRRQRDATTDPGERAELERRIAYQESYREATAATVPTPPNTTLARRLTLYRGGREIRILFFGRGHTGGDVVVHLPAERLLVSGDLFSAGVPYMGDGYPLEWIETLEAVKALDFDWILPGHGAAFQDRSRIDHLQAYLRDFWDRARALHDQGLGAAEAARRIDMRDHADRFPAIRAAGVSPLAVERVWELLEGGGG